VARAVQQHMLRADTQGSRLAAAIEAFAEEYPPASPVRARTFTFAACMWAMAHSGADAQRALNAAELPPELAGRIARALARAVGDNHWLEAASRALATELASQGGQNHTLLYDALRTRVTTSPEAATYGGALDSLRETVEGAPVAALLDVFLAPSMHTEANKRAADLHKYFPELRTTLALLQLEQRDTVGAKETLLDVESPSTFCELLLATLSGDSPALAAGHLENAAALAQRPEQRASFLIEASILRFRADELRGARDDAQRAEEAYPGCARGLLYWLKRREAGLSPDARRAAIDTADEAGRMDPALVLERITLEQLCGETLAARQWLPRLTSGEEKEAFQRIATLLGAMLAEPDTGDLERALEALEPYAPNVSNSERLRAAHSAGNDALHASAVRWSERVPNSIEPRLARIAIAAAVDDVNEERRARLALAEVLDADSARLVRASSNQLGAVVRYQSPVPLVRGDSVEERLVNIDLAPPGSDPRRRSKALSEVGDAVRSDTEVSLCAVAGWSALACKDYTTAAQLFEYVATERPEDLGAWEGYRRAAIGLNKLDVAASACEHLGKRVRDDERAAQFFEQAATHWRGAGSEHEHRVAICFEKAFERDPAHKNAFEFTFRKLRDEKQPAKLLEVIELRLPVVISGPERIKLLWEKARSLRELGQNEQAFATLEYVRSVQPEHVGALALIGEIHIRKGEFELAANVLEQLARVDAAPARNRVTAAIAAVDLMENKLGRFDRSFRVLATIDAAGLSTLATRERYARAAAKTEAWSTAADIFHKLVHERQDKPGRIDAARLAMRIHLEKISPRSPVGIEQAIRTLLEEAPADPEAIDAALNAPIDAEAKNALVVMARTGLQNAVCSAQSLEAAMLLAKVAKTQSDATLETIALSIAGALGDDAADYAFRTSSRTPIHASKTDLRTHFQRVESAPGTDGEAMFAPLFAALGPVIGEAFGEGLDAFKVTKKHRADAKTHGTLLEQLRPLLLVTALELDLYVGVPGVAQTRSFAGEKPAMVVGAGVPLPLASDALTYVAAELLALAAGTTLVLSGTRADVAAIVNASKSLAKLNESKTPSEVERTLARAIPRRVKNQLPDLCQGFVERKALDADIGQWVARTRMKLARGAVLLTLDVRSATAIASVPGDESGYERARAELLQFVLSEEFAEFQRIARRPA
jgi:cellulose synthase operon protein C